MGIRVLRTPPTTLPWVAPGDPLRPRGLGHLPREDAGEEARDVFNGRR